MSMCLKEDRLRSVPGDLDVYIAGFPCKDFSSLNNTRPCLDGPNASIYNGVVNYIKVFQPRTFILENVAGLCMSSKGATPPIVAVMDTLRSLADNAYDVQYWMVNTNQFHLPQNRRRVYIVGVNRRK